MSFICNEETKKVKMVSFLHSYRYNNERITTRRGVFAICPLTSSSAARSTRDAIRGSDGRSDHHHQTDRHRGRFSTGLHDIWIEVVKSGYNHSDITKFILSLFATTEKLLPLFLYHSLYPRPRKMKLRVSTSWLTRPGGELVSAPIDKI